MDTNQVMMDEMFQKARAALKTFENYTQEQIDALLKAMGKAVVDNAESLAQEAVEETGMGIVDHKTFKNTAVPTTIYLELAGKKAVGEIKRDPEKGLIYYAKPKGVISAIIPTTNPVMTPCGNAMMALKGRNVIIMAPHPRAKKVSARTVKLMNEAIKKLGAPNNLIQIIEEPTIESTQLLMQMSDVVLATGGAAMVKAAYSSGKPAYGVGPGNVQVLIDKDADLELLVDNTIMGKTIDNGILCTGEQCLITPKEMVGKVIDAFAKKGVYYISDEASVAKFRNLLFPEGVMDNKIVGQPVEILAKLTGVKVPEGTKAIILKPRGVGKADILCMEKMVPVMIILPYEKWEEAVAIAKENLFCIGAGHTCCVYSSTDKNIEYAGKELPVGRLVVNQPAVAIAACLTNGLNPTTTVGCGSWGGNSISENLSYTHLIDVTTVAYKLEAKAMPNAQEVFA